MSNDDSRKLCEDQFYGGTIGVQIGGLQLDEIADFQADFDYERWFKTVAEGLIEPADLSIKSYSLGRGASTWGVLVTAAFTVYGAIAAAPSVRAGMKVIAEWSGKLVAWQKRLVHRGLPPTLTAEALKLLCVADLGTRFGDETEPVVDLCRQSTVAAAAVDGVWASFNPVYFFIPDRARNVTHLYAISWIGEILHRQELPAFELAAGVDMSIYRGPVAELAAPPTPETTKDD